MSKGASTSKQELPEWQRQQAQEVFQAGKSLAGTPFVPYTGPRVAGFNPDQLRQFQATRSLFESGMQYDPLSGLQELAQAPTPTIQPVTGFQGSQIQNIQGPIAAQIGDVQGPQAATIRETPTFGGATIQQIQGPQAAQIGGVSTPQFRGLLDVDMGAYQSPYTQQVIEQSMADIQRQADISRGQAQSRAIGAGAFGGSRSALLESESQRPYIEQMARTAAGLRESGFQQAQQAALSDLARQQQLGVLGTELQQQRALEQARLGQQAGLTGFEAQQQRAMRQAELAQQAGLSGQDIQARMALRQPELELEARRLRGSGLQNILGEQYRSLGLLGGIGGQQQLLQQRALDVPYGEFQRALQYPKEQFGLLSQAVTGTPSFGGTAQYQPSSLEGVTTALNILGSPFMQGAFGSFGSQQPQMSPVQQNQSIMNPGATFLGLNR